MSTKRGVWKKKFGNARATPSFLSPKPVQTLAFVYPSLPRAATTTLHTTASLHSSPSIGHRSDPVYARFAAYLRHLLPLSTRRALVESPRSAADNAGFAVLVAHSCAAVMGGSDSSGCAFVLDVVFEQSPICRSSHRESLPLFLSEPQASLKS